ncbi:mitogen-activated protein kinase kinase kinase [Knufia peltigerae]|uniref:Mitogen-activated protein kinase kinase kinase n=1 Tax=Knufia peltigerae TaxID=1002370 RepID=A0AA39CT04_9EURO|nr:mitogen-activated protein kinase kinase kinase [Knufia peltigerae]
MDPIPQEEVPSEDMPKRRAAFKIARGQLIGKGTYGRVYLGMNATTGDLLAVKQARSHNQKAAGHDKGRIKEMAPMPSTSLSTTTCGGERCGCGDHLVTYDRCRASYWDDPIMSSHPLEGFQ